jgi:hypothetical protein
MGITRDEEEQRRVPSVRPAISIGTAMTATARACRATCRKSFGTEGPRS